ncbi:MAG: cysteine--tRNA ligase, partial [Pseudomonadota bacterium]
MTEITLYNTAKRRKEALRPLKSGEVSLYLCGPTVYDRAHLGNARPVVVFDVLHRLLKHTYPERDIKYVRNITDIDDKINATARARKEAGDPRSVEELIAERTEETVAWYREDMAALGALPPWQEPRATAYIAQMIDMIEALIAQGAAYEAEGHVLFNVDAYAHYGQLSGRSTEDMIAGARVEVAPYKKNPMDFVLWKPSDAETP